MTDEEFTQYLFNRGYIPKWAYYQLNGKTADENYRNQHQRMIEREKANREIDDYKSRRKAEVEAEIEEGIEETLNDLLKDWQ